MQKIHPSAEVAKSVIAAGKISSTEKCGKRKEKNKNIDFLFAGTTRHGRMDWRNGKYFA
jgi:hypothetical protein